MKLYFVYLKCRFVPTTRKIINIFLYPVYAHCYIHIWRVKCHLLQNCLEYVASYDSIVSTQVKVEVKRELSSVLL